MDAEDSWKIDEAIEKEKSKHKWIRVSKEYPELNQKVFLYTFIKTSENFGYDVYLIGALEKVENNIVWCIRDDDGLKYLNINYFTHWKYCIKPGQE